MNLKALFTRYLPERQRLQSHRYLRFLGTYLHHASLWHLNRRSAAGGVAIGLFVAFVPLPVHNLLAACLAVMFRVNLPLAVLFVWVSNPFTVVPQTIVSYKAGIWLMGAPPSELSFEASVDGVVQLLSQSWQPFVLGCFALGVLSALLGHVAVRGLWRWHLIKGWKERHSKHPC